MKVHRTLVDNGSLVDILYLNALKKMGSDEKYLRPIKTMFFGFTSDSIDPLGTIELALIMGDFPRQCTIMVEFLVVNYFFVFNTVIGRPSLKEL